LDLKTSTVSADLVRIVKLFNIVGAVTEKKYIKHSTVSTYTRQQKKSKKIVSIGKGGKLCNNNDKKHKHYLGQECQN
jgi:hypothetical protein